jgi:hypothetical protein
VVVVVVEVAGLLAEVVVVVELEVVLLQAVNTEEVTNSSDTAAMSHFLLNLFNNSFFSFTLFPSLYEAKFKVSLRHC